jgi:hypothetical protein
LRGEGQMVWRGKLEHGFLEMRRAQGFKEGALSFMRAISWRRGAQELEDALVGS